MQRIKAIYHSDGWLMSGYCGYLISLIILITYQGYSMTALVNPPIITMMTLVSAIYDVFLAETHRNVNGIIISGLMLAFMQNIAVIKPDLMVHNLIGIHALYGFAMMLIAYHLNPKTNSRKDV